MKRYRTGDRLGAGLALVGLLVAGVGWSASAQVPASQAKEPEGRNLAAQCLPADPERVAYGAGTGLLSFVGTGPGVPIQQPAVLSASASPEDAARGYLTVCGAFFGLENQAEELAVARQRPAGGGRYLVSFQQTYRGIPVFAGELKILVDASGDVVSVSGETLATADVDTVATIAVTAARTAALRAVAQEHGIDGSALRGSVPELWIYNPGLIGAGEGDSRLVWRSEVSLRDLGPIRQLVLVDAHSGEISLSINQVNTARNRSTYTTNNTTTLPGTLVCSESDPACSGGDADAVAAHLGAGDTYDFYLNYHGRDSIDNSGMSLISTVHYDVNYRNAFWNGFQMVYGDGYFFIADDIVAHEVTHGVTDYESNLVYAYESGAINESFSDIWGEFVDLTNGRGSDTAADRWLVGEDVSVGAGRDMQNPPEYSDPDRMGSPYYYHGPNDNGGVHTNSGVGNKAAYLMTDGDTFNGYTVVGLGLTKVVRIFYEVQTNILTSGADYYDLHNGLFQACSNLVGTGGITVDDCQQVRNATLATEMDSPAAANDDFDNAVAIGTVPFTGTQGAAAATTAGDDPVFACVTGQEYQTVWYRYTAAATGPLVVDTFGSDYDTVLAVWTGSRGSLVSVACNNDSGGLQSRVQLTVSPGVTYHIEIASL